MSTIGRVLLATDLSKQSANLTNCFCSLCPDSETEVVLAHVVEEGEDADPGSSSYKKIIEQLDLYQEKLTKAGYESVEVVLPKGDPERILHRVVDNMDCDLLMVASHGKGFFQRTFMGSTTHELAQATEVPLFIYKEDDDNDEITPGLDNLLETVMVATDFTKKSLDSLNFIRSLSEHVGRVLFVHVIERGDARSKGDFREKYNNAELFLQELVDEMKIFGIKADFRIAKGTASKQIDAICDQEDVTMVMIAKTGEEISNNTELGSTAENLILNLDRSILLLPASEGDE